MPSRISDVSSAYRLACRSASSAASPAASSCSARTRRSSAAAVAARAGRRPGRAPCRRATRARRGRSRRRRRTRPRRRRTVHPPAKTAMRRNRRCSAVGQQRVAPVDRRAERLLTLGASRGSEVSTSSAWSSRSSSASGVSSRSRAAASSIARGRPSRRRQIGGDRVGVSFDGVSSDDLARSRTARSTRARRVELLGRRRREWLQGVLVFGRDPQRRPARGHDVQRRTALEEHGHVGRGLDDLLQVVQEQERLLVPDERDDPFRERSLLRLLHVERVGEGGEEVRALRHSAIIDTNATPSRNSEARRRPSSMTRRVFPTPPGPVTVTTRCSRTRSRSEARSASRPISGGAGLGQVARQAREPLALTLERGRCGHHDPAPRPRRARTAARRS